MKTIIVVLIATIATASAASTINNVCRYDHHCNVTVNTFCRIYKGCTTGKCRCNDAAGYRQVGDECKLAKKIGESCTSRNDCRNGTCTSGTCTCEQHEHPSSDNNECLQNGVGHICSSRNQCGFLTSSSGIGSLRGDCINGSCGCPASLNSVNGRCEKGKPREGCEIHDDCSINLACSRGRCRCKDNYVWNEPLYVCVHKQAHTDLPVPSTCTELGFDVEGLEQLYASASARLCAAGISCSRCPGEPDKPAVCIGGYVSFAEDCGIRKSRQEPDGGCDFNFRSNEATSGIFTSPNYPGFYPQNIECHYLFFGQRNERILIEFRHFDVDGIPPACEEDTQSDFVEYSNFNIQLRGRKMNRLCGANNHQQRIRSKGSFYRLTFKTNDIYEATGFEAIYQFRTVEDSGIQTGQQDSDKCVLILRSSVASSGRLASPHYPLLYPRHVECHYLFYGQENERVFIEFQHFDVDGIPPACSEETRSDFVEYSNFNIRLRGRRVNRLCGTIENRKRINSDGSFFRLTFKSNEIYDATGFNATYEFRRF